MPTYDDDTVTLDESGLTVKNYFLPGRPRTIRYDDIVHAEIIELGFATGRHQLFGIGPLRPRLLFHWDRKRSTKSHALVLDIGRWIRLAVTPDEPGIVLAEIRRHHVERSDRS